jgi:hypothetical protein
MSKASGEGGLAFLFFCLFPPLIQPYQSGHVRAVEKYNSRYMTLEAASPINTTKKIPAWMIKIETSTTIKAEGHGDEDCYVYRTT